MTLPPFENATPENYAAIGLKCGLEVHQQLLTDTKTFCRCPAGRYSDEYDGTAPAEKKTRKNIYYRLNHETGCSRYSAWIRF